MDAATTFSVTTSAQVLAHGGSVVVQCITGDIYVGGSGVTTSNGIRITQGDIFPFDLAPDEDLYVIAASALTARLLRSA